MNSPVPLFLTVNGPDTVAVDLLSNPQAVVLQLKRTLEVSDVGRSWRESTFTDVAGRAVFWPADGREQRQGTKRLWGELFLHKRLKPSFTFFKFAVRVSGSCIAFALALFLCPPLLSTSSACIRRMPRDSCPPLRHRNRSSRRRYG